jgi:hypothetical protein
VSGRVKWILLLVVLGAILYVLISPLPELAATSTLNFPVLPVIIVVLLQQVLSALLAPGLPITDGSPDKDLPSRNCVLLC